VHAVEFSKIRRSQQTHPKAVHQGNFSNLPHLEVLSNRTGLSFSGRLIHIEDFVVWVFHADTMIRNRILCFSAGVLVDFGSGPFGFRPRQLVYCTTDSEAVKAISVTRAFSTGTMGTGMGCLPGKSDSGKTSEEFRDAPAAPCIRGMAGMRGQHCRSGERERPHSVSTAFQAGSEPWGCYVCATTSSGNPRSRGCPRSTSPRWARSRRWSSR
jgi:hypothetical protein